MHGQQAVLVSGAKSTSSSDQRQLEPGLCVTVAGGGAASGAEDGEAPEALIQEAALAREHERNGAGISAGNVCVVPTFVTCKSCSSKSPNSGTTQDERLSFGSGSSSTRSSATLTRNGSNTCSLLVACSSTATSWTDSYAGGLDSNSSNRTDSDGSSGEGRDSSGAADIQQEVVLPKSCGLPPLSMLSQLILTPYEDSPGEQLGHQKHLQQLQEVESENAEGSNNTHQNASLAGEQPQMPPSSRSPMKAAVKTAATVAASGAANIVASTTAACVDGDFLRARSHSRRAEDSEETADVEALLQDFASRRGRKGGGCEGGEVSKEEFRGLDSERGSDQSRGAGSDKWSHTGDEPTGSSGSKSCLSHQDGFPGIVAGHAVQVDDDKAHTASNVAAAAMQQLPQQQQQLSQKQKQQLERLQKEQEQLDESLHQEQQHQIQQKQWYALQARDAGEPRGDAVKLSNHSGSSSLTSNSITGSTTSSSLQTPLSLEKNALGALEKLVGSPLQQHQQKRHVDIAEESSLAPMVGPVHLKLQSGDSDRGTYSFTDAGKEGSTAAETEVTAAPVTDTDRAGGVTNMPLLDDSQEAKVEDTTGAGTSARNATPAAADEVGVEAAAAAKERLIGRLRLFKNGFPARLRCRIWLALLDVGDLGPLEMQRLSTAIQRTPLDEPNQRVIKSDVERTRARLAVFRDAKTRRMMEQMLTFYCKSHGLKYKQGLNELLAPFLYLRTSEGGFDEAEAYCCFAAFVQRFLPAMFSDDDFTALQCAFHHFKLLLLYHDPTLATFLEQHFATPELYVTPWFLTLFSSKVQLPVLFVLWDGYLLEGDKVFFCYLSLAILITNRGVLLRTEISQLPETLSKLSIDSTSELTSLWRLAIELRQQTPLSFAHIFCASQTGGPESHVQPLQQLESEGAFFMLPQEVLNHAYGRASKPLFHTCETSGSGKHCSASNRCGVFSGAPRVFPSQQEVKSRQYSAFEASGSPGAPQAPPRWKVLLLDLRPQWQFEGGRLPPAIHVDALGEWKQTLPALVGAVDPATISEPTTKADATCMNAGNRNGALWSPAVEQAGSPGALEGRRLSRSRGARLLRSLKWRGHAEESNCSFAVEKGLALPVAEPPATSAYMHNHGKRVPSRTASAIYGAFAGYMQSAAASRRSWSCGTERTDHQQKWKVHIAANCHLSRRCMSEQRFEKDVGVPGWTNTPASEWIQSTVGRQHPSLAVAATFPRTAAARGDDEPTISELRSLKSHPLSPGPLPAVADSPVSEHLPDAPFSHAVSHSADGSLRPLVAPIRVEPTRVFTELGRFSSDSGMEHRLQNSGPPCAQHRIEQQYHLQSHSESQHRDQQRHWDPTQGQCQQHQMQEKGRRQSTGAPATTRSSGNALRHKDERNTSTSMNSSNAARVEGSPQEEDKSGGLAGPSPDACTEHEVFCCTSFTPDENKKAYRIHRVQVPTHHVCLLTEDGALDSDAIEIYHFLTRELALRWVSFVRGGYAACHWLAVQQQLELVDHTVNTCVLCYGEQKRQKQLQRPVDNARQLGLRRRSRQSVLSRAWSSSTLASEANFSSPMIPASNHHHASAPSSRVDHVQQLRHQEQQHQPTGSTTARQGGGQGLNLGGILGAWRRLSSARSPRGSPWKGRKPAAVSAAATSRGMAPTMPSGDCTTASGDLCTDCIGRSNSTRSCRSGNNTGSSAVFSGCAPRREAPAALQLQRLSSRDEGRHCVSCGEPFVVGFHRKLSGAAATAAEDASLVAPADAPVPQPQFQRWASLLSLPAHRLVLLRSPRRALEFFLETADIGRFPCFIEAVLQPPLHLLLEQLAAAEVMEPVEEDARRSGSLPLIAYEMRDAGQDPAGRGNSCINESNCSAATSPASAVEMYLDSGVCGSPIALLSSIAPRTSPSECPLQETSLTRRSLSLLLRCHSSTPVRSRLMNNHKNHGQQQQEQPASNVGSGGVSSKCSSSNACHSASDAAAVGISVTEGYEHLSSWLFNAPDKRLCEVIVTPYRLVLVSGAHERHRKHQELQQKERQQEQKHSQDEGEAGVADIMGMNRFPERGDGGSSEYQGKAQWKVVADLLGIRPSCHFESDIQQQQNQQQQMQDSQTQQQRQQQQMLQRQAESTWEQDDLVDFYSSMELGETHKITSRKNDPRLLCFYFNATKSQPLMILRFPDDVSAKGCIAHVRKMYRAYRMRRHEQQPQV